MTEMSGANIGWSGTPPDSSVGSATPHLTVSALVVYTERSPRTVSPAGGVIEPDGAGPMSQRYRMSPTPAQEQVMRMHCHHARYVWNLALDQNELTHPSTFGCHADQYAWFAQLAEARKTSWLGEGSSSVQQQALRDLRQAFKDWWSNPTHFGAPTRRSRRGNWGFRVVNLFVRKISRKWGEVLVPKAGWVRFRLSRPLGEHRSARVTLDRSGRWHVSFTSPQPAVEGRDGQGRSVGVDRGVTDSIATSDGQLSNCPGLKPSEQRRKRRLQRKMARQQKGSNRREVTKRAIAKLAARETDRRKDWVEKTSTDLVRRHDLIAFEKLNVQGMMASASGTVEQPGRNVAQKRGLNRGIAGQGWAMLATRTREKAEASGVTFVEVRAAWTSQTCSRCGELGCRKDKRFRCTSCGHSADADVNAAKNIKAAGLVASGRGRMAVGPPDEASNPVLVGAS